MTDLPSETREGFAAWHPDYGFAYDTVRNTAANFHAYNGPLAQGWRVLPVTITIEARGTGLRPVGEFTETLETRARDNLAKGDGT